MINKFLLEYINLDIQDIKYENGRYEVLAQEKYKNLNSNETITVMI